MSEALPPLLFDLDGTLVDSRVVVERHWGRFAARHGLDAALVMGVVHGVRSRDSIRILAPELDAEAEATLLDAEEAVDTDGLVAVRGAHRLLAALPPGGWGIVTSGPRALAERRVLAVGLPLPAAMVCGDDVARGKPDPEGFLTCARLLGAATEACVAVEDAPVGLQAARAAGMRVIAITTTHEAADLPEADAVIADLRGFMGVLAGLPGGSLR